MYHCFVIALVLLYSGNLLAWGAEGHRIIGLIAEQHLTSATRAALADILQGEDLPTAGLWADTMRSSSANPEFWAEHAAAWHYVNMPAGQDYASTAPNPRGDAYLALQTFAAILQHRPVPAGPVRTSLENWFGGKLDTRAEEVRRFALRFLLHIIADLQQPLHSGYADDRGGNEIEVLWFGERSNLHRVWDSQLLEQQELGAEAYARRLNNRISRTPASDILFIESAEPQVWIAEARRVLDRIYVLHGRRNDFGTDYATRFVPTVEAQLVKGGLRTAYMLNSIFGGWPIGKSGESDQVLGQAAPPHPAWLD